MNQLRSVVDELVRAGIRSYIGLLGLGEQERSRRLFRDALELSALVAGGPSSRMPPSCSMSNGETRTGAKCLSYDDGRASPLTSCLVLLTVRSMLSTLLVLKTTIFWRKLPELEELFQCCLRASDCVESGDREAVVAEPDEPRISLNEEGSAGTARALNCVSTHEPGTICGCRRNNAIPTRPELSYQPAGNEA